MRLLFAFTLFFPLLLTASQPTTPVTNVEQNSDGLFEVHDNSGLSENALRKRAKALDEDVDKELTSKEMTWEHLSPKADKFDWVQSKSGEWFKGEIIALYDDKLEFDSSEVGLYTFEIEDISQIKSHTLVSVNIENLASFSGILRYKEKQVKIIQGEQVYEFAIENVVSFAPSGSKERDFWSGKATIALDLKGGNVDQYDYTAKVQLRRRTADSILSFDYLSSISTVNENETANNQRLNQKYDTYVTRYFFWTPLLSEYYSDRFKNIDKQITVGAGLGYTMYKAVGSELSFSFAPSGIYTEFESVSVAEKKEDFSPAVEMSAQFETQVNKITEFDFSYRMTLGDDNIGVFKHHMVTTFENELLSWLDLDMSFIWDYIQEPQERSDGTTPENNDYQIIVGLGIEF